MTARVLAFNFLDGADGLAAGITGVIGLGYVVTAGFALSVYGHALAWSLLGASVGFLVFNFPPAKIFMGDSGSTVLGFSVAFLGLDFIAAHSDGGAGRALLFTLLIAGLPLLDASVVVLRRVTRGKSPFHGDRRHFYDYLLAAGWQARTIAITSYLLTALLALTGWFVARDGWRSSVMLAAGIFAALLLMVFWLAALRPSEMKQTRYRAQS